jgi:hypothetical protein
MKYIVFLLIVVLFSCREKKVPCYIVTWVGKDSSAVFCTVHHNVIYYPVKFDTFQDIVMWTSKDSCFKTIYVDGTKYTPQKFHDTLLLPYIVSEK